MIELNLLKQRPVIHGIPSEKDGAKLLFVVTAAVVVVAILTFVLYRVVIGISGSEDYDMSGYTNVVVKTDTTQYAQIDNKDLHDSVESNIVPVKRFTDYDNMSMAERLNYEHVFTYYLFRELSLIVPADVDFSTLSMHNYSKVEALGGVESKTGVLSLFSSLKNEGWALKPKPASLFREVSDGYQFRFEGTYSVIPSKLDSEMIRLDDIPRDDHLQRLKDSVLTVIERTPVVSSSKTLDLLDTKFEGKYRHYYYTIGGRSNFVQFSELLSELKKLSLPISVSDVELSASGGGLIWNITVKITVV